MANMLRRSFGASTLAGFWRHWNPIWSYGLSRFVHAPAARYLPDWAAVLVTFIVSGLVHDVVITALRGRLALVFMPWFALVATIAILADAANISLSRLGLAARAAVQAAVLALCFGVAYLISDAAGLWSGD